MDESFNANYIPLTIKYIRTMKRENVDAFTDILVCAGQLGVQDADFWRAIKEVLVVQRMYRYMSLHSIGDAIKSFAIVG